MPIRTVGTGLDPLLEGKPWLTGLKGKLFKSEGGYRSSWTGAMDDILFNRLRSTGAKRTLFAALFFALITFAVFWGYLLSGNAIVGSDGMGPPADLAMMQEESSYFSAWRAFPALGHINFPSPTQSVTYIVYMELLGLSPVATTKAILVSSFWLAGFAMYLCASRILGSSSAGLLAGLAYLFNQVFLSQVTEAHHYFLIGCAIFPLLFLAIYLSITELDRRAGAVLPVIAITFGTMAAPNLVMIAAIFIILFMSVFILMARGWSWIKRGYAAITGAICVALVLLPTILMKYSAGGTPVLATFYPIEEARLYSAYTFYHSFVLASSENTFVHSSDIGQWTFISVLWILGLVVAVVIPLTAFLSILVKERRQMVVSFLVPIVIFMVLATGTNPPFGEIFTYLFKNVPLMDSLRVYTRFHLMTGFAMAMLLAITFLHIDTIDAWLLRRTKGRFRKALHFVFSDRKRLAAVLAFCLIFPSSAVLTGEIRSFEIPRSYLDPYEWVGEQDGDFRVLNLPFQNVFYKNNIVHYDGYPLTMTMDVGMYSPTFSKKPYAFGLETNVYWTFLGTVINERQFGYRDIAGLLGGSAGVQYVIAQNYAESEEVARFASMYGLTLVKTFEGGAAIYLNTEYQGRVHGLGSLCLASGDRAVIPLIMGAGLVNPSKDGIVLMGQVGDSSVLANLMELSDTIVISNGDLLQMVSEVFPWDKSWSIDLSSYGDKHSQDASKGWITSNNHIYAGLASLPTITTTGKHSLTIPTSVRYSGEYDLLVRTFYGPDAGKLTVSIDGRTVISSDNSDPAGRAGWIRVQGLSLSSGAHVLTVAGDGSGAVSLEQAILVPHDEVESRLAQLNGLLEEHRDKVVYLYSASQAPHWLDGTFLEWMGPKGQGIAASIQIPIASMVDPREWTYDPEAYQNVTVLMNRNGTVLRPEVGGLTSGVSYGASLSLKYEGEPTGDMVATVIIRGTDVNTGNKVVLGMVMLDRDAATSGYADYNFDFTVPDGVHQLEFDVRPTSGVDRLYADRLDISISSPGRIQALIEIPVDGTYYIQLESDDASSDPYITIDGVRYPLTGQNGTYRSAALNLASGEHLVEVGLSNLYSMAFVPASLDQGQANMVVEYERKSNIDYEVRVTTDRAGWILLSESYNTMWVAELDGQELEHIQVNGMVNAFYIPSAGEHTITITFHGQEIYNNMLIVMLVATVVSSFVLVVVLTPHVRQFVLRSWRSVRSRGRERGGS
jgi:hypothetical protein